ncbi:MAG: hypothetical protein NZ581_01785 [Candidatus Caldarchaeum sp.]|nr:hypothetical protein [Candidatus Caldarchaeum sp.]MDW8434919.1 hypothetical protein [Candidatus Caldarchaeum sp.]
MPPVAVIFMVFAILTALSVSPSQTQDPCVTTENKIDLSASQLPLLEGVLAGRLQEKFYRLEMLKPGEMLSLVVKVTTNTSTALNMLMMWEIRTNQFTRIDSIQTIQAGGPQEYSFKWLHANFGDNRPTAICFKIGIFSEARPAKADYEIAVGIDRLVDTGNVEAPDKTDRAIQIGAIQAGQPTIVSGYLASSTQGLDHVDIFLLTVSLGKGKKLTATLTTGLENSYEIAVLDQTGYGLRSNRTVQGTATITLTSEDPAPKPLYLRISNQGGVGGGGAYTVTIDIIETTITTTTTQTPTQSISTETLQNPALPPETAISIVYGSLVAVAAAAVTATIIARRRSRTVVEEEW